MKFKKTVLILGIIGIILGLIIGVRMLYMANDIKGDNNVGAIMMGEAKVSNVDDLYSTYLSSASNSTSPETIFICTYLIIIFMGFASFISGIFLLVISIIYFRGKKMVTSAIILGVLSILAFTMTGSLFALTIGILMIIGANSKKRELNTKENNVVLG